MTQHRSRRPYSLPYARRKLAAAEATLAHWNALTPKDWRQHADKHHALQQWGAEAARWRAILAPRTVERRYTLPF